MPRFPDAQTDRAHGRVGRDAGEQLSQAFERVGLQSGEQGVHAGIIPRVKPSAPTLHLDLGRLRDYALEPSDLHPLMSTLAADLRAELSALESALASSTVAGQVLHQHLHALKGMAGMFGDPGLLASVTCADDACRQGDLGQGLPLSRGLLPDLHQWQGEVEAWLQRYS